MRSKLAASVSPLLLAVLFVQTTFACGPYSIAAMFSFSKHPDYPLENYTQGRLGIVPHSFARGYLYAAYRQINNLNFTELESRNLADLWFLRIKSEEAPRQKEKMSGTAKWLAASKRLTNSAETEIETDKRFNENDYFYSKNCLDDAFETAAKTLNDRIARFGAENRWVREWLGGQETVFANCSGGGEQIPADVNEANAPVWLQKDRNYQKAAAKFYAGRFAEAQKMFEKIASDFDSEWRRTADFVVARALIRQADFTEDAGVACDFYERAESHLENILNRPEMSDFHLSARRLIGIVRYRARPSERLRELPEKLLREAENENIHHELNDYSWLLNEIENEAFKKGEDAVQEKAEKAGQEWHYDYKLRFKDLPASRNDDLTDWLFVYQIQDQDAFRYSLDKWRSTSQTHWLLAALTKAEAENNSADVPALVAAADRIPPASAAYATAAFQQIRLLLEKGERAPARRKLDEVFAAEFKIFPLSTQNKFLSQRTTASENLDEFLRFAGRRAPAFVWNDDDNEAGEDFPAAPEDGNVIKLKLWEKRQMFDRDATDFINEQMPLSMMRQAALNQSLPRHLRKFLSVAVWTRAFVLGNKRLEREFAPIVLNLADDIKPLFARYAAAETDSDRKAAALMAILRYPVIEPFVHPGSGRSDYWLPTTIDSNRGNWWCVNKQEENRRYYGAKSFEYLKISPDFLTDGQKKAAENEREQLSTTGNSSTYLARRAVEFAGENSNQPDVPEILHLAVRATRYGCTDAETEKHSKAAFQLLHRRFPNNPWTQKTPFWFG